MCQVCIYSVGCFILNNLPEVSKELPTCLINIFSIKKETLEKKLKPCRFLHLCVDHFVVMQIGIVVEVFFIPLSAYVLEVYVCHIIYMSYKWERVFEFTVLISVLILKISSSFN